MNYDIPLRVLLRGWFSEAPKLSSPKLLSTIGDVLGVEFEFSQVLRVDAPSGVAVPTTALVSPSTGWQLFSSGESVELELRTQHRKRSRPPLSDLLRKGGEVFGLIAAAAAVPARRLAVVQEGMLGEMSDAALVAAAQRLLRFPASFSPAPFEWDWRCAQVVARQFAGRVESMNTLATVKRFTGTFIDDEAHAAFDRLRVDLDINTVAKNVAPRFSVKDVGAFFTQSIAWHESLSSEMTTFIFGGAGA